MTPVIAILTATSFGAYAPFDVEGAIFVPSEGDIQKFD
jgi:hypothetical protein